jgi:hypothetical protein
MGVAMVISARFAGSKLMFFFNINKNETARVPVKIKVM